MTIELIVVWPLCLEEIPILRQRCVDQEIVRVHLPLYPAVDTAYLGDVLSDRGHHRIELLQHPGLITVQDQIAVFQDVQNQDYMVADIEMRVRFRSVAHASKSALRK